MAQLQGETRDRTTEGQHYRMADFNLRSAVIIYWKTMHIDQAVVVRKRDGLDNPSNLLTHGRWDFVVPTMPRH